MELVCQSVHSFGPNRNMLYCAVNMQNFVQVLTDFYSPHQQNKAVNHPDGTNVCTETDSLFPVYVTLVIA